MAEYKDIKVQRIGSKVFLKGVNISGGGGSEPGDGNSGEYMLAFDSLCICDTAGNLANKIAYTQEGDFTLQSGKYVYVRFNHQNTSNGQLTLNVDNTGAKNIRINGELVNNMANIWNAGALIELVYNQDLDVYDIVSIPPMSSTIELEHNVSRLATGQIYVVYNN